MKRPLLLIATTLATAIPVCTQTITRTSAPAIGAQLTFEYHSTAWNPYSLMVSGVPLIPTTYPGITGTLWLDVTKMFTMPIRHVPLTGIDTQSFPIPNAPVLVGKTVSFQALDLTPPSALAFSNVVELTPSYGVGTITIADGSDTSTATGDLQLATVVNSTTGLPVPQPIEPFGVQPITHFGPRGYLPMVPPDTVATPYADLQIDRMTFVARDVRDPATQHIQLPNGFDLYVVRDSDDPDEVFLVSLDRATGIAHELTDSRVIDSGVSTPSPGYRTQFAFSTDGEIGLAIQTDSSNDRANNQGVPDRIVLIKTDPSKIWKNGKNVLNVSPLAGPDGVHTAFDGTLRIANGVGFVEGAEPSGLTGESALWAGHIDSGERWNRMTVPGTGTGGNFYRSYRSWRVSADGRTMIFFIGDSPGPNEAMDCIAVTEVADTLVIDNITSFPVATELQVPANAGLGFTNLTAALTPDGRNVALVLGGNTPSSPGMIAIVPTNGALAGQVTPFTSFPLFATQVVTFGELHWLSNDKLLFAAGSSPTEFDLYVHDVTTGTTKPLTMTSTGLLVPPFTLNGTTGDLVITGSWLSDNRLFYYFLRGEQVPGANPPRLRHNLKAVNAQTDLVTAITGSEFATGAVVDLDPFASEPWEWQVRLAPNGVDAVFLAAKDSGSLVTVCDDEVFLFCHTTAGPAMQLTANNNIRNDANQVRRIDDLRLAPNGAWIAFAQGIGTSDAVPEDLFVVPSIGGIPRMVSRTPDTGGQGIRRGTVYFSDPPTEGVVWVEGSDSRSVPTIGVAAYWNSLTGTGAPMLLTELPYSEPRELTVLNWSPLNPLQ